jgi:hypothetical protein
VAEPVTLASVPKTVMQLIFEGEARLRRRDEVNEDETVRKVARWVLSQEDTIRELTGGQPSRNLVTD